MTTTTDPRKILEAVLSVRLYGDICRPTVADAVLDASDDLAKQAKAAAQGAIEITSLVTCYKCCKAFIMAPRATLSDALPCGHTPSSWMVGACIVEKDEKASKRRARR